MATNEELEKRIETLEKEVQHLKAILQYQMRNKKKWFLLQAITFSQISIFSWRYWAPNEKAKYLKLVHNKSLFEKNKFSHWYLEHICFYIYKTTWYD